MNEGGQVLVLPSWVRTVILSLATVSIPGLVLWAGNLEYRTRMLDRDVQEIRAHLARLDQKTIRLSSMERSLDVIAVRLEYLADRPAKGE